MEKFSQESWMYDIKEILSRCDELAPVGPGAVKLLKLVNSEEVDLRELADRVRLEPVVSLRLLRAANSVHYSRGRHVSSIPEALMILGVAQARPVISAAIMLSSMRIPQTPGFDGHQFWLHSLWTASNAEYLSASFREAPWIAFTTGLLHDIGRLLFASAWPQEYARVLTSAGGDDAVLCTIESMLFGFDHTQLGGSLLEQWDLPTDICQAIRSQHLPLNSSGLPLDGLLQIADELANKVVDNHPQLVPSEYLSAHTIPLTPEQLESSLPALEKHHERYAVLL